MCVLNTPAISEFETTVCWPQKMQARWHTVIDGYIWSSASTRFPCLISPISEVSCARWYVAKVNLFFVLARHLCPPKHPGCLSHDNNFLGDSALGSIVVLQKLYGPVAETLKSRAVIVVLVVLYVLVPWCLGPTSWIIVVSQPLACM